MKLTDDRRPVFENLEPRLLLSASAFDTIVAGMPPAVAALFSDLHANANTHDVGKGSDKVGGKADNKVAPAPVVKLSTPVKTTPAAVTTTTPVKTVATAPTPRARVAGTLVTAYTETTQTGLELVILGTNSADTITVTQTTSTLLVTSMNFSQTFTGSFYDIAIYGFGGNDTITLTSKVAVKANVTMGDGNDSVFLAGSGADTVTLGAGADLVVTVGGGTDLINGGTGLDSFWVDSADTVRNVTTAETAVNAVHRISSYLQPTSNRASQPTLQIDGQKLTDPTSTYAYKDFSSQPLFVGTPQFNDTQQGYLGDCYFIASLASLADKDPEIIRQMITPLGDGSYAVRFFNRGTATYVRVAADLPTYYGSPIYADLTPRGGLWVALAEKAFAQFRSGQNSYDSLSGGWMGDVYRQVTGGTSLDSYTHGQNPTSLAQWINTQLAAGHAVTCASYSNPAKPIVGCHAYMIKAVDTTGTTPMITVYNPWGVDGNSWDSNPNDGLLKISMAQFIQCFYDVTVCQA
jgi:hypothetical protein